MTSIRHEPKGEIRVIIIDESRLLEGAAIDQCYREIEEVLGKTEESYALLHFGRVTFMSSAALGMLIRVSKKCKEYKIMSAIPGTGIASDQGQHIFGKILPRAVNGSTKIPKNTASSSIG